MPFYITSPAAEDESLTQMSLWEVSFPSTTDQVGLMTATSVSCVVRRFDVWAIVPKHGVNLPIAYKKARLRFDYRNSNTGKLRVTSEVTLSFSLDVGGGWNHRH